MTASRAIICVIQPRNIDFGQFSPWTCVEYKHPDIKKGNDNASGNK
jgi:hypothetical protein